MDTKKIIVAGAGHGGIAAAALLSKAGFDVTVYEKNRADSLGYDWTDIFAPGALAIAGIPMPPEDKYEYKTDMTFYAPNCNKGLRQHVPDYNLEIKMERRDIYSHLINHALLCGVKFVYECEVLRPLLFGNRVVGISTSLGDFYGDLIIDAAGINSPVRSQLPAVCGIEKNPGNFETAYIYRAFFNRGISDEVEDKYKVCLFPDSQLGVSWIAAEENFSDLLIARFKPFTLSEANELADFLRQSNPVLGTQLKRGGQFVKIPVRNPLSLMVCDGYAAIGDSAFMTVPIIGSGIANSLKAARFLAQTVIEDNARAFSAETLWKYQFRFFKNLGSGLAVLACVKLLMTKLTADDLNYLFDKGVLTENDITIGADATVLSSYIAFDPKDLTNKAKQVCRNTALFKKLAPTIARGSAVLALTAAVPRVYDKKAVSLWVKQYRGLFK